MGELGQHQERSLTGISQSGDHLCVSCHACILFSWAPGDSGSRAPALLVCEILSHERWAWCCKRGGHCLCVLVFPSQTGDVHFLGEGLRLRVIERGTVFLMNSGLDEGMKFSVAKSLCSHHNLLKQSSFPWCGKVLFSYCI